MVGFYSCFQGEYLIYPLSGPARAFTLRGAYRQFILRVSAENVDEFGSTNVIVQPDKTLNLVIETVKQLGDTYSIFSLTLHILVPVTTPWCSPTPSCNSERNVWTDIR